MLINNVFCYSSLNFYNLLNLLLYICVCAYICELYVYKYVPYIIDSVLVSHFVVICLLSDVITLNVILSLSNLQFGTSLNKLILASLAPIVS